MVLKRLLPPPATTPKTTSNALRLAAPRVEIFTDDPAANSPQAGVWDWANKALSGAVVLILMGCLIAALSTIPIGRGREDRKHHPLDWLLLLNGSDKTIGEVLEAPVRAERQQERDAYKNAPVFKPRDSATVIEKEPPAARPAPRQN